MYISHMAKIKSTSLPNVKHVHDPCPVVLGTLSFGILLTAAAAVARAGCDSDGARVGLISGEVIRSGRNRLIIDWAITSPARVLDSRACRINSEP